MKVRTGVNPDFADYDEIDDEILDAIEEFDNGMITFGELKAQIGPQAAAEIRDRFQDHDPAVGCLFDDPDDF